MKAILLAAGIGSRLRPLTETIPKCLVPIRGRPLLDYWLDHLALAGVESVLVNTHYLSDAVRRYVSGSRFSGMVTVVHEPELLGTGGTLLANRTFYADEAVLVAHADNLCLCDLSDFIRSHDRRPAHAAMTMMTFETDTPRSCGIVRLGVDGTVTELHEKAANPPGNLANAAVYIFEPEVADFIRGLNRPFVDLSLDVLPAFVGRIHTWHNTGVHRDIGTMESWSAAQGDVREI